MGEVVALWRRLPKWGKWAAVAAVFVVVVAIGAALEGDEDEPAPEPEPAAASKPAPEPEPVEAEDIDVGVPEVVTFMLAANPGMKRKVCEGTETLGPELALASFKRGYQPEEGDPPAADVFAEILARC